MARHRVLAIEHEGYEIAKWLNSIGVAGFILKYRLARAEGSKYKIEAHALEDAKRALRLVRSRAGEWGIDPARVGMIGFSAGGEVTALAGTRFDTGSDGASDPIDKLSSRPDFLILAYPGFRPGGTDCYEGNASHVLGPRRRRSLERRAQRCLLPGTQEGGRLR